MTTMASQITSLTIVYSTVYSNADQRKHQSSASLAFVWGIHRGPVNSSHKRPVTRKMFPFDDVTMVLRRWGCNFNLVIVTESYLGHFLWNCSHVNVTRLHWWLVNMGSSYDLVLFGKKPILVPMLTKLHHLWVNKPEAVQYGRHEADNFGKSAF